MIWKYGRPTYTESGSTPEIVWVYGRPTVFLDYTPPIGGVTIPIFMHHRQQQGQS